MTKCSSCSNTATHVLVDYIHNIVGDGETYCQHHAFTNERENCPCCDEYFIDFEGKELLPTYPAGTLDNSGCCSEHS